MENLPSNIYHKIEALSFGVKQELRKKGIVAPVKNKDGSVKQQCKTIKIHKKHEGTAVPEGKKK